MLTETRPTNIKDLVVAQPKKGRESFFDPHKLTDPSEWEGIVRIIRGSVGKDNPPSSSYRTWSFALGMVRPDLASHLNLTDEYFEQLNNELQEQLEKSAFLAPATAIGLLAWGKILFPYRFDELKKYKAPYQHVFNTQYHDPLDAEFWEKFKGEYLDLFFSEKMAFPEIFETRGFGEDVWQVLQAYIDNLIKNGGWSQALVSAAKARFLYPDKTLEDLGVDTDVWKKFEAVLERDRRANPVMVPVDLLHMSILKAAEIQVTENKVKIILPQEKVPFAESVHHLPQVRRF